MQTIDSLIDRTPDTIGGSGLGSSVVSTLGAILLAVAYASSVPAIADSFLNVEIAHSDETALSVPLEDRAMVLLNTLHSLYAQLASQTVELTEEDARVLYDNLWDLYEA